MDTAPETLTLEQHRDRRHGKVRLRWIGVALLAAVQIERLDQIKWAVLEAGGKITFIKA